MSGEACHYAPTVRNKVTGKEEPCILWNNIKRVTDSKKIADAVFSTVTKDDFLAEHGWILDVDEQGNPTLDSLRRIDDIEKVLNVTAEQELANLRKNYGIVRGKKVKFEEASRIAANFNRNRGVSREYVAVIRQAEDESFDSDNVSVDIIPKSEYSKKIEKEQSNILKQRNIRDALINILHRRGADIAILEDFFGKMKGVEGIYTSKAPERLLDTLYNMVFLSKESLDDIDKLREEVGHFVVNVLGNTPEGSAVVESTIELIEQVQREHPEVIEALLSDKMSQEEAQKSVVDIKTAREGAARELLGRLVGAKLDTRYSPFAPSSTMGRLYEKLVRAGTKIYSLAQQLLAPIAQATLEFLADHLYEKDSEGYKKMIQIARDMPRKITQKRYKALIEQQAKILAKEFMLNEDLGDANTAMLTPEELHNESREDARVNALLKDSIAYFLSKMHSTGMYRSRMNRYMEGIDKAFRSTDELNEMIDEERALGLDTEETTADSNFTLASNMLDQVYEIIKDFESHEFKNISSSRFEMALRTATLKDLPDFSQRFRDIRRLLLVKNLLADTIKLIAQLQVIDSERFDREGLGEKLATLKTLQDTMGSSVEQINKRAFIAICKTINCGEDYIREDTRRRTKGIFQTYVRKGNPISMEDIVEGYRDPETGEMSEDAGWWETYLGHMGRSSDKVNQLMQQLYDYNRTKANDDMMQLSQHLLELETDYREQGITDFSFIYEKLYNGEYSGNVVQQGYNYGEWENAFAQFREEAYKKIKEDHAEELKSMNDFERSTALWAWFTPYYEAWHLENSEVVDEDTEINEVFQDSVFEVEGPMTNYRPNEKYKSEAYDNLSDIEKHFLKRYIVIKQSLDRCLEKYRPGSTCSWRLPQFRGTLCNRLRNTGLLESKLGTKTAHEWIVHSFFEDSTDMDYEDHGDESSFDENTFFQASKKNSNEVRGDIPVYGIRKLKDMHNISTDIIYSTLQYAAMAYNVKALGTTSYIMQNGIYTFDSKKLNGTSTRREGYEPNVKRRYIKFLEMNVFGVRKTKHVYDFKNRKFMLNKAIDKFNKWISYLLLAGSPVAGTVNTAVGIRAVMREAFVGEHYTKGEFYRAMKEYGKYVTEAKFTDFQGFNRQNKLYMFIRYFDVLDDNDTYFREFKRRHNLGRMSRMSPFMFWYTSGNHWMQCLPYIAKGIHTKMYTIDPSSANAAAIKDAVDRGIPIDPELLKEASNFTERGSLWDLFDDTQMYRGKKIKTKDKDEKRRRKEDRKNKVYHQMVEPKSSMVYVATEEEEEEDGVADRVEREKDWGNPFKDNIYFIKDEKGRFVLWDGVSRSQFQTRCRYLTNRLHGLYNNSDSNWASQIVLASHSMTLKKWILGAHENMWASDRYIIAEKKNREGYMKSFNTFFNFSIGGKDWGLKGSRLLAMSLPMLTSLAIPYLGGAVLGGHLIPVLIQCAYMLPMYRLIFRNKSRFGGVKSRKTGKRITYEEYLKENDFSQAQVENLRRFNKQSVSLIWLHLLAFLCSGGFAAARGKKWKDLDDEERKMLASYQEEEMIENGRRLAKLEPGEELDVDIFAWLADKCFGYETYKEDVLEEIGTKKTGLIKENGVKIPGMLSKALEYKWKQQQEAYKDHPEDLSFWHSWNTALYLVRFGDYYFQRLTRENASFAPIYGNLSTILDDYLAIAGNFTDLAPASYSKGAKELQDFVADDKEKSLKGFQGNADKEGSLWDLVLRATHSKDVPEDLQWEEYGIDAFWKFIRSAEFKMVGDSQTRQQILESLAPYFTKLEMMEEPHKKKASYLNTRLNAIR